MCCRAQHNCGLAIAREMSNLTVSSARTRVNLKGAAKRETKIVRNSLLVEFLSVCFTTL